VLFKNNTAFYALLTVNGINFDTEKKQYNVNKLSTSFDLRFYLTFFDSLPLYTHAFIQNSYILFNELSLNVNYDLNVPWRHMIFMQLFLLFLVPPHFPFFAYSPNSNNLKYI
jgi:hypothetical protein